MIKFLNSKNNYHYVNFININIIHNSLLFVNIINQWFEVFIVKN